MRIARLSHEARFSYRVSPEHYLDCPTLVSFSDTRAMQTNEERVTTESGLTNAAML